MQALIEISKSINFFDSILISFPWKVPSRNQRKETQYEFTLYKHTVKICRSCKYFVEWSIGFLANAEQPLFLFWTSLHSIWNSYINLFFYQLIFIFLQPHTLESLHIFTDIYSKKKKNHSNHIHWLCFDIEPFKSSSSN